MQYFHTQHLFLSILLYHGTECAKILGIFHIPGPSQYLAGKTLMSILAERGHGVTIVTVFGEKEPPKNYKNIVLDGVYGKFNAQHTNMFHRVANIFSAPLTINSMSYLMVESVLNHTKFQDLMNSAEKFDLVIMEQFQADALKYVAYHFKAPLIVYSSMDANDWTNPYQGNPASPSYTPSFHLPYTCEMTFWERLKNSVLHVYSEIIRISYVIPKQNELLHKYFPEAPHLNTFIYNVSLVLLNSDFSVYEPLPRVPSMVNIGGFHIEKTKPLPEDLQEILDNAKDGAIFFSLGSNLKSKLMPREKLDIILRALSKFKETVLWKFEDENLQGKPDNVVIRKWLPQSDILAHKNIKLFITHGGIFSTMEAVYHGVPILALPVFADQFMNSRRAAVNGYAIYRPFRELTEESFQANIEELLKNQKYKENALKRSFIMRDKPLTPAENLVFWVEYIIRHKGAPHLRVAGLDLNWFQYVLLDVVAFITIALIVLMLVLKFLVKLVFCKSFKNSNEINKKNS